MNRNCGNSWHPKLSLVTALYNWLGSMRNLGGSNALVVSDPGVLAAGWRNKSLPASKLLVWSPRSSRGLPPIRASTKRLQGQVCMPKKGCYVIIAVGGGSVIDCAKCIGLLAANQGDLRELFGVDNVRAPMPPTICIPTTAGTPPMSRSLP